ncbi:glycosyl transferase, group 2 family protein [Vulgatibacter incomptus]|uniref:Glycosyl transferase, group 2 family protein n=1 Tax=Vulgatibacter incomptus TaxID=1391653 RepID=A0A0K1PE65_9BACT|nr:glycosyl transferase, group 2 family protein [Vulgatibacter incomptus]
MVLAQLVVLAYFAGLQILSFVVAWRGVRTLWRTSRDVSRSMLDDLVEQKIWRPVSILVPAHNEARTIVESVRALSKLRFPEFEIIVVSDGSTDDTVRLLTAAFDLEARSRLHPRRLPCAEVKRILTSRRLANLTVVEKERGGKADALNAALNLAKYPLVCTVDADSLIERDALLRAARIFANDEKVVAVGGAVRPLNGALVEGGTVQALRLPRKWLERIQILEYGRAFFTGRVGWGSWNALTLISGAFGVFHRETVLAVGGYRVDTVGEDLDLVVRLHKHCRSRKIPYRIVSLPVPMCWTQVPADLGSLRAQRNRWQRGLWETLWAHRDMLFRPSFGRLGFVSIPYLWLFEGLAPFVEILGYLLIPICLWMGWLAPEIALYFVLLAAAYGLLLSLMGLVVEMLLENRYASPRERLVLILGAFLEMAGPRQILAFERLLAFFQVWTRKGEWGRMKRQRIGPTSVPPPKTGPGLEGSAG